MIDKRRYRRLNLIDEEGGIEGPVIYWMSRDQRMADNWALIFAQEKALERQVPLTVLFCLQSKYLGASDKHFNFMLEGLSEVAKSLKSKNISFRLLFGDPEKEIVSFATQENVSVLVTDFSPLRLGRHWRDTVAKFLKVPFYEVDSHNIIPPWEVSDKEEYAAFTIRPKIHKRLSAFLTKFPAIKNHPYGNSASDSVPVRNGILYSWIKSGSNHASKVLEGFIHTKGKAYDTNRNDPTKNAQSNLSPYLHFGQISSQRIALEIEKRLPSGNNKKSYLEELIVRRELAENFCFYNKNYDSFEGFPNWAQKTLKNHENDKRSFVYTHRDFEHAKTHDPLWNAAQIEMVKKGKMHGYMRMYWAKKILEWSKNAIEAVEIAIYLNDSYELDGRDPNGYAGVAWSIGGVHDRPFFERPIYGLVRPMSYAGMKKKFKIEDYIEYANKL